MISKCVSVILAAYVSSPNFLRVTTDESPLSALKSKVNYQYLKAISDCDSVF